MESRSREELCEDIADALLDLDDSELVKIANKYLPREVSLDNGNFIVGASDFQPIKRKYDRRELHEVLTLDGKKLSDGDRIVVQFPDGTEYEAVLEDSEVNSYLSKDNFHFLANHHGVNVRVNIVEGMKAKW